MVLLLAGSYATRGLGGLATQDVLLQLLIAVLFVRVHYISLKTSLSICTY